MKPVWWPWPTFHADPLDICHPPCSFAICHCSSICSRTKLRLLSLPWAADVLLRWPTKEHDTRLVCFINLCVLQLTLQGPNAYSYPELSQTAICCVLVKADLWDRKFSFQNNCKYVMRQTLRRFNQFPLSNFCMCHTSASSDYRAAIN